MVTRPGDMVKSDGMVGFGAYSLAQKLAGSAAYNNPHNPLSAMPWQLLWDGDSDGDSEGDSDPLAVPKSSSIACRSVSAVWSNVAWDRNVLAGPSAWGGKGIRRPLFNPNPTSVRRRLSSGRPSGCLFWVHIWRAAATKWPLECPKLRRGRQTLRVPAAQLSPENCPSSIPNPDGGRVASI